MNRSIFTMAAIVTMAGTLGASAWADDKPTSTETRESHPTILGHRILSVSPHWVEEIDGKRTRHLTGVDIRIEAEPGMTAEYLTVELRRDLTAISTERAITSSVFGVQGSKVAVRSTGDGFVLQITAPDTTSAKEVVRRAQRLD